MALRFERVQDQIVRSHEPRIQVSLWLVAGEFLCVVLYRLIRSPLCSCSSSSDDELSQLSSSMDLSFWCVIGPCCAIIVEFLLTVVTSSPPTARKSRIAGATASWQKKKCTARSWWETTTLAAVLSSSASAP
jgi:hypothetical protein